MTFQKEVTFISATCRESKGNVYHSVTVEDVASGEVVTLSCDAGVCENLKKYTQYTAVFNYTVFKGDGRLRLAGFKAAVDQKKTT